MQVWGKVLLRKSKTNGDKIAVATLKHTRQLVDEFLIDFVEELKHMEANPMCSIH